MRNTGNTEVFRLVVRFRVQTITHAHTDWPNKRAMYIPMRVFFGGAEEYKRTSLIVLVTRKTICE